jgi:hypothetical protein
LQVLHTPRLRGNAQIQGGYGSPPLPEVRPSFVYFSPGFLPELWNEDAQFSAVYQADTTKWVKSGILGAWVEEAIGDRQ